MHELFNSILKELNLDSIYKVSEGITREEERPCVVFLDLLGRSIELIITASQIFPESFFIVSNPNWVQYNAPSLYLLQGITVDDSGRFIHVIFETPQRITCLSNFSQAAELSNMRCEDSVQKFELYESLAECPVSDIANNFPGLKDKLGMYEASSENFVNTPKSLGISDYLLVEKFIDLSTDKDLKLKIFLTRRPNDTIEISAIISQQTYSGQVVEAGKPEISSFDQLCDLLRLEIEGRKHLKTYILQLGESIFISEKTYELGVSHNFQNKQLDFLVIDLILRKTDSQLNVVFIKFDTCEWFKSFCKYRNINGFRRGDFFGKWIETMMYRSYRYMLKGKNILLIGGGGYSKLDASKFAFESGINIIIVDSNGEHPAKKYSSDFLNIDIDDHTKDIDNALEIVKSLHSINRSNIDGVVTFWEDNVPLSSLVSGFLGKKSNSYQSASIAKSKLLTHKKIIIENCIHNLTENNSYGVESYTLRSIQDVDNIPSDYYPLVIKVDTGSAAFGVEVIRTQEDLLNKFENYKKYIESEPQYGAGLTFDYKIFVAPYLQGSEHDVDLIIFNGDLVGAYLSDNGPTMSSICKEMTVIMPSLLNADKRENLIYTAWKACQDIGLTHGVFNVELMHTSSGPKILEINARMGGFYIPTWMFNIWDVDLILYSYVISCGIKPFINRHSLPRSQYNGFLCYTSLHGHLFDLGALEKIDEDLNLSVILLEENVPSEEKYEVPYASVSVNSQDINKGKIIMKKFLEKHSIGRDEYQFICEVS